MKHPSFPAWPFGFALALAAPAFAADDDPFGADPDAGQPSAALAWDLELAVRRDTVRDLPDGREIDRHRARLRAGLAWLPAPRFELRLALKANQGDDADRDTRRNLDNEEADDAGLDTALAGYAFGPAGRLEAGKGPLPLVLTPMLWDADLRPSGVHWRRAPDGGGLNVVLGAWRNDHLFDDDSTLRAAQLGWQAESAPGSGWALRLAVLQFDDLERLAAEGLGRTNCVTAGRHDNDFRVVDLGARFTWQLGALPVAAGADAALNLDAEPCGGATHAEDRAGRVDLRVGNARRPGGLELGLVHHRIQREALPAAFNDDDWWFRTRMRGGGAWLGWGLGERTLLRLAAFQERRDDLDQPTRRLLLELQQQF